MSSLLRETVSSIHHWNEELFTFRTSRSSALRFHSGHFVMLGLEVEGRPLMRAYSIASPHYAEHLEFLSIKVPNGPLTSRLKDIRAGDEVLISSKPVGTLLIDDLLPGEHLYLFSSGTGLAPFMSIIQDPTIYERFRKIVLVHSVRRVSDLAYARFLMNDLPQDGFLGDMVRAQLLYLPTVTRESFHTTGRITTLMDNGTLARVSGLPELNAATDRVMLCGSASMLADLTQRLEARGLQGSPQIGQAGHFVIEKAFAQR
ncbi:ferredoxin--NADP reductase [Ottowia thiooxydans]|uniref:ferredoxin--NADP(+) reductase n=1 Tax=Ottowia thiooxydans TaxID=219182 RepID=A0ABV2Q3I5_9BURK